VGEPLNRALPILACVLALTGCLDLLGPTPDPDDPAVNFDALWTEFDRHYSFFELKSVDWDSLYAEYGPRAAAAQGQIELIEAFGGLLDHLEDGHVNIYTPTVGYAYTGWYEPYPVSFHWPTVQARLSGIRRSPDQRVVWGDLGGGIGYVHVGDFGTTRDRDLASVVRDFEDKAAMIVDVRSNGGGSDRASRGTVGHFTAARFHYRTIRYRDGPRHTDFSDPIDDYVEPTMDLRFDGPVVVLTNRRTFSAAEDFVLAMRQLPQVTVVGDTTGGGSGNPIFRELPNGWTFRLSRWLATDPGGFNWEGVGIPPDTWVVQTDADAQAGEDPVLDEAVAVLETALAGP
jgi:hypothetical protein